MLHLPAVKAEKEIRDILGQSELTQARVYRVVLARTGDEDQADRAAAKWLQKQLDQGNLKPDLGWD